MLQHAAPECAVPPLSADGPSDSRTKLFNHDRLMGNCLHDLGIPWVWKEPVVWGALEANKNLHKSQITYSRTVKANPPKQ